MYFYNTRILQMKYLSILLCLLFSPLLTAQLFSTLTPIPEAVSNNAVCAAMVDGVAHVYSFSGIDQSKAFNGIHKRSWHYNPNNATWSPIPDLPLGAGRIAAGASTVKDKIYIIGGYQVFASGTETSFNNVHIFDPVTNNFEQDGMPIPVAIDDHIQAVWKDSLIYVITGWSNNGNVPNVQIYDPGMNTWEAGTPVPNNNDYKVFGGSGVIVDNTIYYLGGARSGSNFPITTQLRKGVIDPHNPTEISWSIVSEDMGIGYRSAAINIDDQIYWIGGSETTYNYDGIAYNNSGGVEPRLAWTQYDITIDFLHIVQPQQGFAMPEIMDLRGIAHIGSNEAVIVGGMLADQEVSDQVFKLTLGLVQSNQDTEQLKYQIVPNPSSESFVIDGLSANGNKDGIVTIYNIDGRVMYQHSAKAKESIDIAHLDNGMYLISLMSSEEKWMDKLIIKR